MTTNIRDVTEGGLVRSLAYVFAQLKLFCAKDETQRRSEPRYHMRLTPFERARIRRQLRRDLKDSLELLNKEADRG